MQLILASASPRRSQILRDLGVQFAVQEPPPEAERALPRHLPLPRLRNLLPEVSQGKALAVGSQLEGAQLVLAADTVVYAQGQILGKPGGGLVARRHLETLSQRTHRVLSAVSVLCCSSGALCSRVEETQVRFQALDEQQIERYVGTGEPLDKAGSYGIQGWGGLFVEWIRGRYDNVVGLPLCAVESALQELGYSLYDFRA